MYGPAPVLLAAWLVPGGGHFLLGRRPQAVVFFMAVTVTYFGGMFLADFGNVSLERHTYYFLAHILNGGETLVAWLLTRGVTPTEVPRHFGIPTGEIGILYTAVASLLNLIVMMDAFGIAAGLKPDPEEDEPEDEAAKEKVEASVP
jgi:hypothetical protein